MTFIMPIKKDYTLAIDSVPLFSIIKEKTRVTNAYYSIDNSNIIECYYSYKTSNDAYMIVSPIQYNTSTKMYKFIGRTNEEIHKEYDEEHFIRILNMLVFA